MARPYSAMLFLLPERNTALVLEQNLYGLLHDEAVMQVGLGAVRILTAGRPRPQSPRPATTRPSGASRPWIALTQLAGRMGLGQLMTWVPDAFIAVCLAAAADAAIIVLRLVLANRSARVGGTQPQSGQSGVDTQSVPHPLLRTRQ